MGMHSASTVLDDIIDELRLKYDSSVGLLDGDAVREIPNLNTLQNLGKLLAKLSTSLAASEEKDQALLLAVDAKIEAAQLRAKQAKIAAEELEKEAAREKTRELAAETPAKRERAEEGENEEYEEAPLAKRRKNNVIEATPMAENEADEKEETLGKTDEAVEGPETVNKHEKEGEEEEKEEKESQGQEKEAELKIEAGGETKEVEKEIESKPEEEMAEEVTKTETEAEVGDEAKVEKTKNKDEVREMRENDDENDENEENGDSERLNSKDDPTPPVQTGSYTQENDTRLKNPKSEFVSAQTLSEAAITELGLFCEENNGLETQGKEYLKKKYGVASYPENDLKRMLPGEIPDMDFLKTKAPSNQVQFSTYQSYIELYFRPFANEDIAFANEKYVIPPGFEKGYDPVASPYLIPKLGRFYTELWADEDAALGAKLLSPAFQRPPLEAYRPKGNSEDLVDEILLTEDVSCGPLSTRLLLAILSVHEAKCDEDNDGDGDNGDGDNDNPSDTLKSESSFLGEDLFGDDTATHLHVAELVKGAGDETDFHSMEDRLKRELKYIGIFANTPTGGDSGKPKLGSIIDSDDWVLTREDDEVCAEIRLLQRELKGAVSRNRRRKKALVPVLEEHLAYQEFCTILEDLDKQVDLAYTKRLKAKSKRKKLAPETASVAQQQTANSGLRSLLEKRSRWISNIGRLFPAAEVMKRIPDNSVFGHEDASDDDEGDADVEMANNEAQ